MGDIGDIEESLAHVLENKVVKLANDIKRLQQVVKEAEERAKLSEQKVRDIRGNLVQAEKEKNEAVQLLSSFKMHNMSQTRLEKESFLGKIQSYVDLIKWMKEDSKENLETILREHAENVAATETKIEGLKYDLEMSQKECVDAKFQVEAFKTKVKIIEGKLKKESEVRKNAELVAAAMISQLEDEMAKKLAELEAAKEIEIKESELNFKELENIYHDQTQILLMKEELLVKYEEERESLSKITKLGMSVAGDQAKGSVKKISERGRSLVRNTASRGRSLVSRSRSRSVKRGGKDKQKIWAGGLESNEATVDESVIEMRTDVKKSQCAGLEELNIIEEDLKQMKVKEYALKKYKKELAARLETNLESTSVPPKLALLEDESILNFEVRVE